MAAELAVSSLAAAVLGLPYSSSLSTGVPWAFPQRPEPARRFAHAITCCAAALTDLSKKLQGPDAAAVSQALLSQSPTCQELLTLFDQQQRVRLHPHDHALLEQDFGLYMHA